MSSGPEFSADCPLCEAERITMWFHEDEICWIAECEICATPMVVWRSHGIEPSASDLAHMMERLADVANTQLGDHWVDPTMRNIPDHFHAHARPAGGFFGPNSSASAMTPGEDPSSAASSITVYEAVGGLAFFTALVERFYAGVDKDPVLRPLYPADLSGSKAHLAGFLAQYWGGGTTHYSDDRGHPRLRMRHAGFRVGPPERDAWLRHMSAAVRAAALPAELESAFLEYFDSAATHLINT